MQKSCMKPVWQFLWIVKNFETLWRLMQSFCVFFSNEPYDFSLESCWWCSPNALNVRCSLGRYFNKARTGREQNRTNEEEEEGREKSVKERKEGREPDTSLCNNKRRYRREETGSFKASSITFGLQLLLVSSSTSISLCILSLISVASSSSCSLFLSSLHLHPHHFLLLPVPLIETLLSPSFSFCKRRFFLSFSWLCFLDHRVLAMI